MAPACQWNALFPSWEDGETIGATVQSPADIRGRCYSNDLPLAELTICDEADYAEVTLFGRLKQVLVDAGACYRIAVPDGPLAHWAPVALLNLTYWSPEEQDDILAEPELTGDVVAHRAWHHLAHRALKTASRTVEGLLLGEAVASAFDIYLVGKLLSSAPDAAMLQSQLPLMAEVAEQAGLDEHAVQGVFERMADAPEESFEAMRSPTFRCGRWFGERQNCGASGGGLVVTCQTSLRALSAPLRASVVDAVRQSLRWRGRINGGRGSGR